MISRIGSGTAPEVKRVRQVESGPSARSSSEVRQAGTRAAAIVRIGAEARARAAASAAEARAAAAMPDERAKGEDVAPVASQALPDFYALSFPFKDASIARVSLEQFTDQLGRAKIEP